MNHSSLAEAIQRPDVHRKLLGNYRGAYALGVTDSPEDEKEPALLLRVEQAAPKNLPTQISIGGEAVPVVIIRGYKKPKPL